MYFCIYDHFLAEFSCSERVWIYSYNAKQRITLIIYFYLKLKLKYICLCYGVKAPLNTPIQLSISINKILKVVIRFLKKIFQNIQRTFDKASKNGMVLTDF